MKKRLSILAIGLTTLLAACSNATIDIELSEAPEPETMSPANITIMADGDPVTDFEGTAEFRMVDMDHGTEVAELTHVEAGTYEGDVNLPMPGAWTIDVIGESDDHGEIDTTIEVDI